MVEDLQLVRRALGLLGEGGEVDDISEEDAGDCGWKPPGD
jgi:hypothetical protein